jgi:hypothetical protein
VHSNFIENLLIDLEGRTPLFKGASVTVSIRARLELNTHSKHLKIATTLTVRMFSPYKNYSSLLRWQANCVYILLCANEGMLWFLEC